jgi:D-serine deaminase-like pyridoxal phosphate-dependent protein
MSSQYAIADTSRIITPALVIFREIVASNLRQMIAIAGDASRLRPHCKTHKMAAVTQMELELGITKHKCATIAEAEMLADAGVKDILLAYNVVGANVARCVEFVQKFPGVNFMVTADHEKPIAALSAAMQQAGAKIGVALDINIGMNRTGVAPGERAKALYKQLATSPGLVASGLHVYDGQNHQHTPAERSAAIEPQWQTVLALRDDLVRGGLPVPRTVVSGTPGFPVHAKHNDPTLELSPGTTVFHDAGSIANYPDLPFTPAALVLTRVVSLPSEGLVTFDVGSKGIASDPPVDRRVKFIDLPDAQTVSQNEEHLVVRTPHAAEFSPGDERLVIPWHVCPTSAMHKDAYVVAGGEVVGRWPVTARDRCLTV